MSIVYELYPILEGIDFNQGLKTNIIIKKGETATLIKEQFSGWIIVGNVLFKGDPRTPIFVRYKSGDKILTLTGNPNFLQESGLTGYGLITGATISKYSTSEDEYNIVLNPPEPIPYKATPGTPMTVTIEAKYSDVFIIEFGYKILEIKDPQALVQSLNRIFGTGLLIPANR